MFQKILIANRGEIACRVIDTARRLGVRTAAVYSDADAAARHVEMADEAYHLGPPPAAESYLLGEKIIAIAVECGAEAIHPGYGFLSEDADFAARVTRAGLRFIGPSAEAIRVMGRKDSARAAMLQAGVPVVPGYHGTDQGDDRLVQEAGALGYPVLIKPSAGGGGKAIHRVSSADDMAPALKAFRSEANSLFGDSSCVIEKYIAAPRHIEVQVFGDDHGALVHLFERDCSLQRRNQKVIEESPAPGMSAEMREAMYSAALRAAGAVGYSGAGTVEFIADGSEGPRSDRFWFMEMNTRLQVEHPVTEAVTGIDLVEWQLLAASGEPLPRQQAEIAASGHAFEARIYAEDVQGGFLPATGQIEHLTFPPSVRVDCGVQVGDRISPWYDPMIAKIIVHGPTRRAALNRLRSALEDTRIAGTMTNLSFLSALSRHAGLSRGGVDTRFIHERADSLTAAEGVAPEAVALAALVGLGIDPFDPMTGWHLWITAAQTVHLCRAGEVLECGVLAHGGGRFSVRVDGAVTDLRVADRRGDEYEIEVDGRGLRCAVVRHGRAVTVFHRGSSARFEIADPLDREAAPDAHAGEILAPMPGLVRQLLVQKGDSIRRGDTLLVLEAMKMEHVLQAPFDGVIAETGVRESDQVAAGQVLMVLEAKDA